MEQGIRNRTIALLWLILSAVSVVFAQPCLPEGITFTTQSQVDSFPILYPNCTEIEGTVYIWDADITGLSSLNNISSIGGGLEIFGCNRLTDLTGLEGISHIGGGLMIVYNDSLTNLLSFSGLTSIGGRLQIISNNTLNSLSGLDNIAANTIENLSIFWNDSLSTCDVASICSYLAIPNPYIISIYDNDIGCNSISEVEDACMVGIPEQRSEISLSAYPNPFATSTTIKYELTEPSHVQLTIYNAIGGQVYKAEDRMMTQGKHTFTWTADKLPDGLYYAVLRSEEGVSVVKMIKQ